MLSVYNPGNTHSNVLTLSTTALISLYSSGEMGFVQSTPLNSAANVGWRGLTSRIALVIFGCAIEIEQVCEVDRSLRASCSSLMTAAGGHTPSMVAPDEPTARRPREDLGNGPARAFRALPRAVIIHMIIRPGGGGKSEAYVIPPFSGLRKRRVGSFGKGQQSRQVPAHPLEAGWV